MIAGHAHNNAIGGFQPSIEPDVTVDASGGYGIQITGSAKNNDIFHTDIGTNPGATTNLGNTLGGIYLAPARRAPQSVARRPRSRSTFSTVPGGRCDHRQVQRQHRRGG